VGEWLREGDGLGREKRLEREIGWGGRMVGESRCVGEEDGLGERDVG